MAFEFGNPYDISFRDFLKKIGAVNGLARNNRFMVRIETEPLIKANPSAQTNWTRHYFEEQGIDADIGSQLTMMAANAQLPGYSFTVTDMRLYGPTFAVPFHVSFQPVPVTFYLSNGMQEKAFFDSWKNAIHDWKTFDFNYWSEYTTQVAIAHLDPQNNIQYGVVLYEAYPISVNFMDVGHDRKNELQTLQVLFAYRYWQNLTIDSLATNNPISTDFLPFSFNETVFEKPIGEGTITGEGTESETPQSPTD